MPENPDDPVEPQKTFKDSLRRWGGWSKLAFDDPKGLVESVFKTLMGVAEHHKGLQPLGAMTEAQWRHFAATLAPFLNAYLQQDLNEIIQGPDDLLSAFRMVEDEWMGQLLMALVIVAREHRICVEVEYRNPYSKTAEQSVCRLFRGRSILTLTIKINDEHGEEMLPLKLHYHGEELVRDQDEDRYVHVPVDRRLIIFFDGNHMGRSTLQQHERDDFLRQQGFQIHHFSAEQIENDVFDCAAKAIETLCGKTLPPPNF